MAHELFINGSGDASMMYVGTVPWHELGQQLDEPPTAEVAIKAARLDWEVVKTPLFYHLELGKVGIVPGHYALVPGTGWGNSSERPVFGVVSEQYTVLQNHEAFAFFDPIVASGVATYETAGALGKGERVWVLAKVKGDMVLPGDDVVNRYLLLANSHDGESAVQIKFTPVRVVCNNTLTMALEKGRTLAISHTWNMQERLANAQHLAARILETYARIEDSFNAMLKVKLADRDADDYFNAIFPMPLAPKRDDPEALRRHESLVKRAKRDRVNTWHLYRYGVHNTTPLMQRTLWAAYNSATEYVDQYYDAKRIRDRDPAYRLNSAWFGVNSRTKNQAYETAVSMLSCGG